jgi:hypothetical protein
MVVFPVVVDAEAMEAGSDSVDVRDSGEFAFSSSVDGTVGCSDTSDLDLRAIFFVMSPTWPRPAERWPKCHRSSVRRIRGMLDERCSS